LKVARVVTSPESIFFVMRNTLNQFNGEYDLTIIAPYSEDMPKRWPKIKWIYLDLGRKISLTKDIANLFRLILIFRKEHFDIVHSLMPKTSLMSAVAGFIARVPIRMHTFTGQVWATKSGIARWALRQADRLVCALNTHCSADSASQIEFLKSEGIPICGKIDLLADGSLSGVDLNLIDKVDPKFRADFRATHGIPQDEFVFIFLGRKRADKGVLEIIDAISMIPDRRFTMVFVGPDEGQFSERLQSRSLRNVIEIGFVNNPLDYISVADGLLLPSHREGFPNVIIESGALGIPSIGTNIPGMTDSVVNGKTGILVPVKNPSKLAEAMMLLSTDRKLAKEMGAAAKIRARTLFSCQRLFEALTNIYKNEFSKRNP